MTQPSILILCLSAQHAISALGTGLHSLLYPPAKEWPDGSQKMLTATSAKYGRAGVAALVSTFL